MFSVHKCTDKLILLQIFQGEHENIMSEHHRATNALRTTTADNKILISQHQGALQREREQWNVRMAEQERMLEKARSEMAQEVAREKEKQQLLENDKYVDVELSV